MRRPCGRPCLSPRGSDWARPWPSSRSGRSLDWSELPAPSRVTTPSCEPSSSLRGWPWLPWRGSGRKGKADRRGPTDRTPPSSSVRTEAGGCSWGRLSGSWPEAPAGETVVRRTKLAADVAARAPLSWSAGSTGCLSFSRPEAPTPGAWAWWRRRRSRCNRAGTSPPPSPLPAGRLPRAAGPSRSLRRTRLNRPGAGRRLGGAAGGGYQPPCRPRLARRAESRVMPA